MRNEVDDPLLRHEIQERFAQRCRLLFRPLQAEIFADQMLGASLDLTRIQAVTVLGSYTRPVDPDNPNSELVLSPLTQGRLEAGVFCLRPWMTLVACGRNLGNEHALSDAEAIVRSAAHKHGVKNPMFSLPQGFTTAGEMLTLSQAARDNGWKNVIVITNSPFIERTASMAYTLTFLDISMDTYIAVGTYLEGLWDRFPKRRADIENLFDSFYSLADKPYRGSFTFVSPAQDRGKPIHIDRLAQEMQGVYQWRNRTYR